MTRTVSPLTRTAVYLAGPLGFTEAGRHYHDNVVRPAVKGLHVDLLDPWPSAEAIFDQELRPLSAQEAEAALPKVNMLVGEANEQMIRSSSAVLAIVDGTDVDSGTAAEIGFACAIGRPVVGLRSDLRMSGENLAAPVNLQVQYFIQKSGGQIVPTLERAVECLRSILADRTRAAGRW